MLRCLLRFRGEQQMNEEWFAAAQRGDIQALEHFHTRKGVSVNEKDKDGNTALHHAVQGRKLQAAEWLIKNKAKIDKQNKEKKTAFDLAVETDYKDMIHLLDRTRIKKLYDQSLNAGAMAALV